MPNLEMLFRPKTIAVVGVSEEPGKLGSVVLSNLRDAGFEGEIYIVNPKHQFLYGQRVYSKVSDIPVEIDLVIIIVPAPVVPSVMEECAEKNVKGVIIITAGFKETGEEGKKLEEKVLQIAKDANIRIIGPNCLGLIIPQNKLNASFAAGMPIDGDIAFMSQSGAICTALLDMAIPAGLGFSHFVSVGNKSDINENELMEYFLQNHHVKVIGAYLEDLVGGYDLIKRYLESFFPKPFVVLKPGKSKKAQIAMSSHTGSIAAKSDLEKIALEQHGIIQVDSIRGLYNLMMGFSWLPCPTGKNVAIITNAGGPGIIATDEIISAGLEIAELSESTINKLKEVLPPSCSLNNPIDVIGDALADRYKAAIETLLDAKEVDVIFVLLTPQLVTQIEETARVITLCIRENKKTIIPVIIGQKYTSPGLQRFFDNKIVAFKDIKDAVSVVTSMLKYAESSKNNTILSKFKNQYVKDNFTKGLYHMEIAEELKSVQQSEQSTNGYLSESLASKIAWECGLSLPEQGVFKTLDEIMSGKMNKFPLVIKATNRVLPHKTDYKAVFTNIKDTNDLKKAYSELEQNVRKSRKELFEVLVQEQVPIQLELIIGAIRTGDQKIYNGKQKGLGHFITFGAGGIYTEIMGDTRTILAPATRETISGEWKKLKVAKIAEGARGLDILPLSQIIDAIEAIQRLVLMYPEIESVDINPLIVNVDRVVAADVKFCVNGLQK